MQLLSSFCFLRFASFCVLLQCLWNGHSLQCRRSGCSQKKRSRRTCSTAQGSRDAGARLEVWRGLRGSPARSRSPRQLFAIMCSPGILPWYCRRSAQSHIQQPSASLAGQLRLCKHEITRRLIGRSGQASGPVCWSQFWSPLHCFLQKKGGNDSLAKTGASYQGSPHSSPTLTRLAHLH